MQRNPFVTTFNIGFHSSKCFAAGSPATRQGYAVFDSKSLFPCSALFLDGEYALLVEKNRATSLLEFSLATKTVHKMAQKRATWAVAT